MALWWLGNLVLIVVVVPVVIFLLRGVLNAARTVKRTVDDLAEAGGVMVSDLEPIYLLVTTLSLVTETSAGLKRYGAALDKIL